MLTVAKGTLSLRGLLGPQLRATTERIVKYIANRPAKNISSLESQTMVPTDDHVRPVDRPMAGDAADAERVLE